MTHRQTQIDIHTYAQTYTQTDTQTDTQTYTQIDLQEVRGIVDVSREPVSDELQSVRR